VSDLLRRLQEYQDPGYARARRGEQAYRETRVVATEELARLVSVYNSSTGTQCLRLLRDAIDHWLRRVHGYSIAGAIGSHYVQQGYAGRTVFEHVIPASTIRDMLLANALTPDEALRAPTCMISVESDQHLRSAGLVSTNPNPWRFFQRYRSIPGLLIHTHDGRVIDLDSWTLEDHFQLYE
jgi:hypothetical protein